MARANVFLNLFLYKHVLWNTANRVPRAFRRVFSIMSNQYNNYDPNHWSSSNPPRQRDSSQSHSYQQPIQYSPNTYPPQGTYPMSLPPVQGNSQPVSDYQMPPPHGYQRTPGMRIDWSSRSSASVLTFQQATTRQCRRPTCLGVLAHLLASHTPCTADTSQCMAASTRTRNHQPSLR